MLKRKFPTPKRTGIDLISLLNLACGRILLIRTAQKRRLKPTTKITNLITTERAYISERVPLCEETLWSTLNDYTRLASYLFSLLDRDWDNLLRLS